MKKYCCSLIKLPNEKMKKKHKLKSIYNDNAKIRRKTYKPVDIKNKQKRNIHELNEKMNIARKLFDPFAKKHNENYLFDIEQELRNHFSKMANSSQKGGSFLKKALKGVHNIVNRVKTTITGRNDLRPIARKVMSDHGNEIIKHIKVIREPIISIINKMINVISLGNQTYDKLFHLYMIVTTDKGTKILIEKNEVINITTSIKSPHKDSESIDISVTKNITLNELIDNTKKYMGSNFLYYSASHYNCQNFIDSILTANNINSQTAKQFIMQDPKEIFKHMPAFMSPLMNKVTGLASKADVLLHGVGKKKKLNHLLSKIKLYEI